VLDFALPIIAGSFVLCSGLWRLLEGFSLLTSVLSAL
jgi:hypothetical protein